MKKLYLLIICLLLTISPIQAKKVKLSITSMTLAMGGKKTVKVNAKGKWSIKDSTIAQLSSKKKKSVMVKAKKAGTTQLICTVGKKTYTCKIKVLNNTIGKPLDYQYYNTVVGVTSDGTFELYEGDTLEKIVYDKKKLKLTNKSSGNKVSTTIKTLKPGKTIIEYHLNTGEVLKDYIRILPKLKSSKKKTKKNYKKWRQSIIKTYFTSDMTTWDMIDCIGKLIQTGKYSYKGGVSSLQLWHGGTGTCVSGAQMMNDFMKDLGITSKVRFVGNQTAVDIQGYQMMYASQHKNTRIKLGGKTYDLNVQPGNNWPYGIVKK